MTQQLRLNFALTVLFIRSDLLIYNGVLSSSYELSKNNRFDIIMKTTKSFLTNNPFCQCICNQQLKKLLCKST